MSSKEKAVIELSYSEMLEALNDYTIKKYGFHATHVKVSCVNNEVNRIRMSWDGTNGYGYRERG